MKPEDWQKAKEIFHRARGLPPEKRAEFLNEACRGKDGLCEQVEILLESYESEFLEKPLFNETTLLAAGEDVNQSETAQTKTQNSPDTEPTKVPSLSEINAESETDAPRAAA